MRFPIIVAGLLAACGGGNSDPILPDPMTLLPATVYKSLGSVQCTGGGTTLAGIQKQLTDAGVTVLTSSCGTDGLASPAVCGAGDGKIAIFDIPPPQLSAALALSFGNLTSLPDAKKTSAC